MAHEAVIVTGGRLLDLGQLVPGNGREVMVFVVIAHIEGYGIQDAIIAKRLLDLVVGQIVLLDPAGAERVQADGEEEAKQQVNDCFGSEEIPHGGDENDLRDPVQRNPFIEGFDLAEARDAEDLPDGIEKQPDNFSYKVVVDELCFPAIGQVGIQLVYSLEGVVFDMIALERDRAWEKLGEVGEDTGEAIGRAAFEQQVVGALMDHNEKGMVSEGSQQVSDSDHDPPGLVFHCYGKSTLG